MRCSKTILALLGLTAVLVGFAASHIACHAQTVSSAPSSPEEGKADATLTSQNGNGVTTLRVATHQVLLDVSVFDWKNDPVTGLTKDDFHLLEDGKEQSIRSFEEHTPTDPTVASAGLAAVPSKLAPNTFTNFKPFPNATVNVVVIDTLTSTQLVQQFFRDQLASYMKTVPSGTPFIFFKLDSQLHMLQGLTSDPAIERDVIAKRLGKIVSPANISYIQRRQIVGSALEQLTQELAGIPDRKTVLWFSEAIGIALSSTGGHDDQEEGALFCKWTDVLQQNRIEVFRGGADGTVSAGLGCQGSHNGGRNIAAIVDKAAHYYTLTYAPSNADWDGHYRKVKLNVSGKELSSWKGVNLDYRQGYNARPDDGSVRRDEDAAHAPNVESRAMQLALRMGSFEPNDVVFEANVSPSAEVIKDTSGAAAAPGNYLSETLRQQGYRNYAVQYAVRANQFRLLASPDQTSFAAGLEVLAILYDAQGKMVNSKKGKLSASFASPTDPKIQTASVTANLNIQVPVQGNYFLRLCVSDTATDKVGALEIPVDRIALASK
jgi:VWFA-related protein